MNEDASMPSRVPWPPILYLGALALGLILNIVFPLPWLGSPGSDLLLAIGVILIAGAALVYFSAFRALKRGNTTIMPHRASDHLVTDGPFSFSRNPLYLANTMLALGIALAAGIVWLLPLAFIAAWATQKLSIEGEERHLAARFGKRYRDYQKKVRRWI